jgi:hypothetical protein
VTGSTRWLHVADSFSDLNSLGRMHVAFRDVIRPHRWSGWYHNSASVALNISSSPSSPAYTVTPGFGTASAGFWYNHYTFAVTQTANAATNDNRSYVIGDMCNGNGGASGLDTTNGPAAPPAALALDTLSPTVNARFLDLKCSPHAFRELLFTANVADSTTLFRWDADFRNWMRFNSRAQPTSTTNSYGDWTASGGTITARLIYFRSSYAPTGLTWRTTRGGTVSNTVTFNPNGADGVTYVDANFAAATTASNANRLRPEIVTQAGIDEYSGSIATIVPILGVRYFDASRAGLEMSFWSQPGWNLETFVNGDDTISSDNLTGWLDALGWPTHISIQLGQNQTAAQTSQLNLGVSTQFKADYRALLAKINGRYDAAGLARPVYLFISPWILQADYVIASSRNTLNYATMDLAIYELAVEFGASFFSFYQTQHTPEDFTDAAPASSTARGQIHWSSDDVHQNATGSGSLHYVGTLWGAMQESLFARTGGLRGRP